MGDPVSAGSTYLKAQSPQEGLMHESEDESLVRGNLIVVKPTTMGQESGGAPFCMLMVRTLQSAF